MRKILLLILITFSVKSQSQIINIKDDDGSGITNAYYQDIDFVLDPFEGTYLYTNGNISLKIVLVKIINHYNSKYYEDAIIGGYEYKIGDNVIITTLNDINLPFINPASNSIAGNLVINNNGYPPCSDCSVGEKRLLLSFSEFSSNIYGTIVIRKIVVSNQEAIKINIRGTSGKVHVVGTPLPPDDFKVPCGEYILIKQ